MLLLAVLALLLLLLGPPSLSPTQAAPADADLILNPAQNAWRHDALHSERYRRGFVNDDAVEDEHVDRSSIRRAEDHFVDVLDGSHSAKVGHGIVDDDGALFTSSTGRQYDAQQQAVDRRSVERDHLGVRRRGASTAAAGLETGRRSGRTAYRTALGGPFQAADYAVDLGEYDRVDAEQVGRDTDYAKDADRALVRYDRGTARRSAEAGVLIAQDGALGAGSDGVERGAARTARESGAVLAQSLLERGGDRRDFHKAHDGRGRVRARRASTAFGPDGATAADVAAQQESWDRGDLRRRDQVRFAHAAHDRLADHTRERSKADVDLKVMIGQGIPGDMNGVDRRARAANLHDRLVERDAADRVVTQADSETLQTFDIGARSVIDGNGVAMGIPALV